MTRVAELTTPKGRVRVHFDMIEGPIVEGEFLYTAKLQVSVYASTEEIYEELAENPEGLMEALCEPIALTIEEHPEVDSSELLLSLRAAWVQF